MPDPLAFFLTWTCHGTWLHGDPRGSIDSRHNSRFTPPLPPDPKRQRQAAELLRDRPSVLSSKGRAIVHDTIVKHCAIRGWNILALNVRTNHVHVVVQCATEIAPETAMEQFKAWATRRLREAGEYAADQRVWTEHGSTRWINTQDSLKAAVVYALEFQDQ